MSLPQEIDEALLSTIRRDERKEIGRWILELVACMPPGDRKLLAYLAEAVVRGDHETKGSRFIFDSRNTEES